MYSLNELRKELNAKKNSKRAKLLSRYFKTGKGEYAEGDKFLGINVPELRKITKKYHDLDLRQIKELIKSKIHEHRMIALFILMHKYKSTNHKKIICHFYLKNTKSINNWDLVDLSAPNIIGVHLLDKDKSILYKLAKSDNLWERRIAVLSTFTFIKNRQFDDSLKIAEILLNDEHDLIHKAVGWMLREIGKRDMNAEEVFLKRHCAAMPRTMLRYAIEKFPQEKRKLYLAK